LIDQGCLAQQVLAFGCAEGSPGCGPVFLGRLVHAICSLQQVGAYGVDPVMALCIRAVQG
jgi:hypothetical protein